MSERTVSGAAESSGAPDSSTSSTARPEHRARRLHLRAWHRQRGAVLGQRGGSELPLHYGDPEGELELVRRGCALVDQSDAGRLELLGADRKRFLNGLVTVDVAALGEGEARHGFATEAKGRIVTDVTVLDHADRLWLQTAPGREQALSQHLLGYRVADRVEVLPMEDLLPLTLVGRGLAGVLAAAGVELPPREAASLTHRRAEWFGTELHLAWSDRLGAPALVVWVSSSIAGLLAQELLDRLGAGLVGDAACEVIRLEAGIPRFGVDYDSSNLPGEVGTLGGVDWKKGCYLGQEIVARMHYRGQPARRLRRLRVEGERLPEAGTAVSFEDRPAGSITSVARSPGEGGLALAMLQRRASEPGTVVEIAGCASARVETLPGSEESAGSE